MLSPAFNTLSVFLEEETEVVPPLSGDLGLPPTTDGDSLSIIGTTTSPVLIVLLLLGVSTAAVPPELALPR